MTFEGFIGVCLLFVFLVDPILILGVIFEDIHYKKITKRLEKLEREVFKDEKKYR